MPLLIAVLLGLSGLIVVLYPLLGLERQTPEGSAGGPVAEVAERERSARDALREVEFDHRLGNLDDADYQTLRSRYERRALAALKVRYQKEQELDALIEQRLDALRVQQREAAVNDAPASSPSSANNARRGTIGGTQSHPNHRAAAGNDVHPASGPRARRKRGGRG